MNFLKILFLLLFGHSVCISQQNNNISQRLSLALNDSSIFSTTQDATVEWECINNKLTQKCLKYHNDQWFTFKIPIGGKYYLNISNQSCLDKRGIQLVLIEGNPCEVETYAIKKCISKLPQHDICVEMDSLKKEVIYLLNIDGFLQDQCAFNIQLASYPQGQPIGKPFPDTLKLKIFKTQNQFQIQWHVDQKLAHTLKTFKVYRSKSGENFDVDLGEVFIEKNTLGTEMLDYSFLDTLTEEGVYTYKIYGIQHNQEIISLHKEEFHFLEQKPIIIRKKEIELQPGYRKGTKLEIYLYNSSQTKLYNHFYYESLGRGETKKLNLSAAILDGQKQFLIKVKNIKTMKIMTYIYKLNEDGSIERQQ